MTHVDAGDGDFTVAVEFEPYVLHGFPELGIVLRILTVHFQDVQACRENLRLSLDRDGLIYKAILLFHFFLSSFFFLTKAKEKDATQNLNKLFI